MSNDDEGDGGCCDEPYLHRDEYVFIVFIACRYKAVTGSSSRSYGLNVARLAGISGDILQVDAWLYRAVVFVRRALLPGHHRQQQPS
jgi:hypothetical protein